MSIICASKRAYLTSFARQEPAINWNCNITDMRANYPDFFWKAVPTLYR